MNDSGWIDGMAKSALLNGSFSYRSATLRSGPGKIKSVKWRYWSVWAATMSWAPSLRA